MAKLNVKKGDTVLVLAGKDKGKSGKIIAAFPKENRVVVENVNIHTKHKKARNAQEKSGIEKIEASIDASNVQIICPVCGKATRVAHKIEGDNKQRVCKKCGASLDVKAAAVKKEKKTTKTSKEEKDAVAEKPAKEKSTTKTKSTASKTKKVADKEEA